MGNEKSSNWDEDYTLISRFKNIKKLQNKRTHEQYDIVSVYVTPSTTNNDSVIEHLSKKKKENSPYLIPLERIESAQEPTYCGTKTRYDLVYRQAYPSLDQLMQERAGQNPCFSLDETKQVVSRVALGLKDIHSKNEEHGHINLNTICVLDNLVRLKDPVTIQPSQDLNYELEGYPSPQKLFTFFDRHPLFDQFQSDLFSLGMVALQLYYPTTNIQALYVQEMPYMNYALNLSAVNQLAQDIRDFQLRRWVQTLLSQNTKERANIFDLISLYRPIEHHQWIKTTFVPSGQHTIPSTINTPAITSTVSPSITIFKRQQATILPKHEPLNLPTPLPMSSPLSIPSPRFDPLPTSAFKVPTFEPYLRPYVPIPSQYTDSNVHSFLSQQTPKEIIEGSDVRSSSFNLNNDAQSHHTAPTPAQRNPYSPMKRRKQHLANIQRPHIDTQRIRSPTQSNEDRLQRYLHSSQVRSGKRKPQNKSESTKIYPDKDEIRQMTKRQIQRMIENEERSELFPSDHESQVQTHSRKSEKQHEGTEREMDMEQKILHELMMQAKASHHEQGKLPQNHRVSEGQTSKKKITDKDEKEKRKTVSVSDKRNNSEVVRESQESVLTSKHRPTSEKEPEQENNLSLLKKNQENNKDIKVQIDQTNNKEIQGTSKTDEELDKSNKKKDEEGEQQVPQPTTVQAIQILKRASARQQQQMHEQQKADNAYQPSDNQLMGLTDTVRSYVPYTLSEDEEYEQQSNQFQKNSILFDLEPNSAFHKKNKLPQIQKTQSNQERPRSPVRRLYQPKSTKDIVVVEEGQEGRYEGHKLNGKKHGKGIFLFTTGYKYEGDWVDDVIQGQGTLYYPSGRVAYVGEWKNGTFDGKGHTFNSDPVELNGQFDFTNFNALGDQWTSYEGDFKSDALHGVGKWVFSNGEYYEGELTNGMINGRGKFATLNGNVIHGIWDENILMEVIYPEEQKGPKTPKKNSMNEEYQDEESSQDDVSILPEEQSLKTDGPKQNATSLKPPQLHEENWEK